MKRTIGWAAIAVVLGVVVGACAQTSSADVTRRSVNVTVNDEKAKTLEQVDGGETGFGPSDQIIEDAPLIDSTGKTIGNSFTTVTIVSGESMEDAYGLIDCHIVLQNGTLFFTGSLATKELGTGVTLPVTGGTGAYAGAGGTVRMAVPNETRTNLSFDLLIPKVS